MTAPIKRLYRAAIAYAKEQLVVSTHEQFCKECHPRRVCTDFVEAKSRLNAAERELLEAAQDAATGEEVEGYAPC